MKTASKGGITNYKGMVKHIERISKDRADKIEYSIYCKKK